VLTAERRERSHHPDREPLSNESSWVWIGFQFGAGFSIAAALVSAVSAAIFFAVVVGGFSSSRSKPATPSRQQSSVPRYAPEVAPTFETVRVPPRSVEDCKAETGGQINEQFKKCRAGYTYEKQR